MGKFSIHRILAAGLLALLLSGSAQVNAAPKRRGAPKAVSTAKAKEGGTKKSPPGMVKEGAIYVRSQWRSPRNAARAYRKSTTYIILHTTEGASKGSLSKLSRYGECNYVIDTDGTIYRIIDRGRVAMHAGLSMWNGRTGLDSCSIGIEMVGYHDKDLTAAQYASLRQLLSELKRIYRIPDKNVLTHSMVAFGKPNHWHPFRHRGRKRCAMLLALPSTRTRLGLSEKPLYDPDVRAGRLRNADPMLAKMLYTPAPPKPARTASSKPPQRGTGKTSAPVAQQMTADDLEEVRSLLTKQGNIIGPGRSAWDIARDQYNAPTTIYTFPNGSRKSGAEITQWKAMPSGTVVSLGAPGSENSNEGLLIIGEDGSATEIAGDALMSSSTFYFPAKARYQRGSSLSLQKIEKLPAGTGILLGYKVVGPVTPRNPVFNLCGVRWNRPDTYYWTDSGKLTTGDRMTEKSIPQGAMVFLKETPAGEK